MSLLKIITEENMSISDAIRKMINDLFRDDIDDPELDKIVNRLSLIDILDLNQAYKKKDKAAIRKIIGPLPQLEYVVKQGRNPVSAASNNLPNKATSNKASNVKTQTTITSGDNENDTGNEKNGIIKPIKPTKPKKPGVNQNNTEIDEQQQIIDEIDEIRIRAGLKK